MPEEQESREDDAAIGQAEDRNEDTASGDGELVKAPRLVFFYAAKSGKCRRVEGFLAQILQRRRNHDTFVLLRVDVDERPDLAERFEITGVPTLLVIANGGIRARVDEPNGKREIAEALAPWLK